jgi:small subunit ribosomal protein S1
MTDFGAFVEIEPGVEGLVHIGDISWSRIKHPREFFKKGQEVEVQILDIDTERKRISLGYKQLNDPWKDIDDRYHANQDVEVKVVRLADFGAFVQLEEGVEGLIHISQLSRRRVESPQEVLQEGQEVTARILEVNAEGRRIRLSLSALQPPEEGERERRPQNDEPRRRRHESDRSRTPDFAQEEANVTLGDLWQDAIK